MVRSGTNTIILAGLLFCSCIRKDKAPDIVTGNYPKEIADIIINRCAIGGCHNSLSSTNAAGLNLSTWDTMFNGGYSGAVVIPYRPDFSPLCFFTNTYNDLGVSLQPTMPVGAAPLTRAEYLVLRNWITSGAPDASGSIKFADNPSRKKFYVTNRKCNVVTVIDGESLLQMRYVDVGGHGGASFPCSVLAAPDRRRWYVSFYAQTNFVQQFSADDDQLIGDIDLGLGTWTSFVVSADSRYAWFVDNSSPGKVAYVDLDRRSVLATYSFGGGLKYPTGIALNDQLKELYVGSANGNFVYNISIADPLNPSMAELPVDGTGLVQHQSMLDPVELLADPRSNKCYIACAASGEIKVIDMASSALVGTVSLGSSPAFMALSPRTQKLFVSCPDDQVTFQGNRGAVVVIDVQTNSIARKIKSGYQPYGVAIDDEHGIAAIVNANISSGGPASHHETGCGKKNGNVTLVDLATLNLVPGKSLEVAVFPFSISAR